MSHNKPDISQIRKYLNGELDARAMYELELLAHHDPLLMDLIRGMEYGDEKGHQHNLNQIDQLVNKRVQQEKKRSIALWKLWPLAASLLVGLTLGGFWLLHQQLPKPLITASTTPTAQTKNLRTEILPVKKPILPSDKSGIFAKNYRKSNIVHQYISAISRKSDKDTKLQASINNPLSYKNSAHQLKEVMIIGYTAENKKSISASVSSVSTMDLKIRPDTSINRALAGRAFGLNLENDGLKHGYTQQVITGRVVDKEYNTPLPGVSVKIRGTQNSTQTDTGGRFRIVAPIKGKKLDIAMIGYNEQQIKIQNNDSLKIALSASSNSLNEVVVEGYGTAKIPQKPKPIVGWKTYKKYIDENAIMPNGKTGTVKLAFTVDSKGEISNIRIIKGLNDIMNQKAIELIHNGPKYVGDEDRLPKEIKLKIKFHK